MKPSLVIGLTGGIGSGKSTVAALFRRHGVPVIDADAVAREVVEPGQPALEEIARVFGEQVLDDAGALDRRALRARVFDDDTLRHRLEAIVHPRIRARMADRLGRLDAPYAILEIPLLVETGQHRLVDRTLVVDAPREAQISRTRERDGVEVTQIERILDAQAGRARRIEAADDVIGNEGGIEALDAQVAALHERYLDLARGE